MEQIMDIKRDIEEYPGSSFAEIQNRVRMNFYAMKTILEVMIESQEIEVRTDKGTVRRYYKKEVS